MSGAPDDVIAELEELLEDAERSLISLGRLNDHEAERVGARMDRLASQLLETAAPPSIGAVHRRLGTTPASEEDFASVREEMAPADGEG